MRIRKWWSDALHHHLFATPDAPPPPDLVSSVVHDTPPITVTKINISVCSNQNSRAGNEEKSNIETAAESSVSSSLSGQNGGGWKEEEKVYPVEKMKTSLERFVREEEEEKEKRCARNNGMGWRCSKQRAKGYALCDHHVNQSRKWKRYENIDDGGSSGLSLRIGKKRQRMMMMSDILSRTMPLLANADSL